MLSNMDITNDVRFFLMPEKNKRKGVYIIDCDNYQANLDKIISSKRTAFVLCLCSSKTITQGVYNQLSDKTKSLNKVHIYTVSPGQDATDVFMASLLGWMIGKYGKEYDYYLISRDHIFEHLKVEYAKLGYNIEILTDIE